MKLLNKITLITVTAMLMTACSASKETYQAGAVGGVSGGLVGAGAGAAIGASLKNGSIGKSAALGGAVGVPVGIAAGIAIEKYGEYSEEKELQDRIDMNSAEIAANEREIANKRAEADDQNRVIEVSPSSKRHIHTGPTLGNVYRP